MRFLLILTLLILTCCESSSKPELHLLTWSSYLKPELVKEFEEKYHIKVIIDTFDSNETMYAKLKLGKGGYDLIFPSNYFLEMMINQEMLELIDPKKIPNLGNIDPLYLKKLDSKLTKSGVPYMVTTAGIGYRKDKLSNMDYSWGVFGNSAYKGRMTMLNDMRETLGAALLFLKFSANTTKVDEIDAATQLLMTWKNNFAKFENEQYKSGISNAEFLIVQGYNGDILQVIKENPHVDFIYPKEGITIAMDLMAIPKTANNSDLAYLFINYLLEPEVGAELMTFTSFLCPNQAAYPLLPENFKANPTLFMPSDVLEKAELIRYLGEEGLLYNRAWDKIKSG